MHLVGGSCISVSLLRYKSFFAELRDASSADCQQAGACQPLWWWVRYQEGSISGNCGGKVHHQAAGPTGPDTIEQQGECATSWGCESCAKEDESPA